MARRGDGYTFRQGQTWWIQSSQNGQRVRLNAGTRLLMDSLMREVRS